MIENDLEAIIKKGYIVTADDGREFIVKNIDEAIEFVTENHKSYDYGLVILVKE